MTGFPAAGLRNERGAALLLVLVFNLLSLAAISVFHQRIRTVLCVVESEVSQDKLGDLELGLAQALSLMETGLPPENSYACAWVFRRLHENSTLHFEFRQQKPWEWSVAVHKPDMRDLPTCPEAFAEA